MKTLLTKAETLTPHGHIECAAEAHGVARAGAIDGASLTLLAPPQPPSQLGLIFHNKRLARSFILAQRHDHL